MGKTDTTNFIQSKGVANPPTDKFRQRVLDTEKRTKRILFAWLISGIFLAFSACPLISSQTAGAKKLMDILDTIQFKQVNENGELTPKPTPKPQDIVFETP